MDTARRVHHAASLLRVGGEAAATRYLTSTADATTAEIFAALCRLCAAYPRSHTWWELRSLALLTSAARARRRVLRADGSLLVNGYAAECMEHL